MGLDKDAIGETSLAQLDGGVGELQAVATSSGSLNQARHGALHDLQAQLGQLQAEIQRLKDENGQLRKEKQRLVHVVRAVAKVVDGATDEASLARLSKDAASGGATFGGGDDATDAVGGAGGAEENCHSEQLAAQQLTAQNQTAEAVAEALLESESKDMEETADNEVACTAPCDGGNPLNGKCSSSMVKNGVCICCTCYLDDSNKWSTGGNC